MYTPSSRRNAASLTAIVLMAIAGASARLPAQSGPTSQHDYVQADVDFVQGMIGHHAQAVVMSDWAPTHGARADLQVLCKRIALSQHDEITMMQSWLQDRHLSVPDPLHMLKGSQPAAQDMGGMDMPGMSMGPHQALMPGMLTPEQMRQLDAAHGTAFDTLYLKDMIGHHEGALGMVATLFATPGAGQQADLFGFATDVDAGQRAEIGRMQAMLKTFHNPSPTQ